MKNRKITGLRETVAIGCLLLLFSSCKKPEVASVEPDIDEDEAETEVGYSYPFPRLLTDSNGRELQAMILGRTADQIMIEREVDGKQFSLPIEKLSAADAAFVKRLPEKAAPQKTEQEDTPEDATPLPPSEPLYITNRLKAIESLKEKIEVLKEEIKAKVSTPTLSMSRKQEIKNLEKEIAELEIDISTYKRNNKLD